MNTHEFFRDLFGTDKGSQQAICYIPDVIKRIDEYVTLKANEPRKTTLKKYLVSWVEKPAPGHHRNRYTAFTDGSSEENLKEATELYNTILEDETTYTANLCEIIQSTDY